MNFDWTVRVTDIAMIAAIFAGPIAAVQLSEFLRRGQDSQARRVHLFRTLMATRSATLALAHIESLNLVEIEFHTSQRQDRQVVDCCRVYIAHLNDHAYPKDSWGARRADLLIDLLYQMSLAIGYSFDKADIKRGAYYPHGYEDADIDNFEARKLWLQVLRNERPIRMHATIVPLPNDDAIKQFLATGELVRQLISGETTIPVSIQKPKSDEPDDLLSLAGVGRVSAPSHSLEQAAMPLSKTDGSIEVFRSLPAGGPYIGVGETRSAPIGVGCGEIGATRNMGATIIRRDGIIPPMIGADTRPTLAVR